MFAEGLREEGFSVWWDAALHSGETFDEVIERNLRDARAVVVLWSTASVASRWVRAEATQADRRNKLAPAIIEPCDRPIIFELTHAAELHEWTGDLTDVRWRNFVEDLRRLVDREHEDVPAAAAPAQPASPQRRPLRPGSDQVISAGGQRASSAPNVRELRTAGQAEAPAAAELHCLEINDSELGEDLFVIDTSSVKMGRNQPAEMVIPHKSVSREHCIVGLANDELLVTDLNSTNGTYVDDVRISRATVLPVGSVLRLGQVCLTHSVLTHAQAESRIANLKGNGPEQGRLVANS
jgi:hypothetical protein